MLNVGGRIVRSKDDLPPVALSLLRLIPYGDSWLQVLAQAGETSRCSDAFDLLAQLQTGLHGDPIMMFHEVQLAAHPGALERLRLADVKNLVAVELGEQATPKEVHSIQRTLADFGLLTEADLRGKAHSDFLQQTGLADSLLMRSQSLSDRIALHLLVEADVRQSDVDLQIHKEAGSFAIGRSANMGDFTDYYRFYLNIFMRQTTNPAQSERRAKTAEALAGALSEIAYELLWAPTLSTVPSVAEIPNLIAQWAARGRPLGFPRLSTALAHLVKYCPVDAMPERQARQRIESWIEKLQALWVKTVPESCQINQAGTQWLYSYRLPDAFAQLSLASDGSLTIANYKERAVPS